MGRNKKSSAEATRQGVKMKIKNRKTESNLQSLINIGPATVKRLHAIGIKTPSQLKKSNPEKIYEKLKQKESDHLDICVLYQLRGAILNAPWWMCKDWKGGKKYGV